MTISTIKKWIVPLLFILILNSNYELLSQTFPAGFSQTKVGTIYYPTGMAKAPDGRMFITEKDGKVKILKNGVVLNTPFITLPDIEKTNERGLGGIAIDP